jgi:hypothetical protein
MLPQSFTTLDRGVHAASSLAGKSALKRPEGRAPWLFAFHPVGEVLVPVGKDWGMLKNRRNLIDSVLGPGNMPRSPVGITGTSDAARNRFVNCATRDTPQSSRARSDSDRPRSAFPL